jgi:hypothetical protein
MIGFVEVPVAVRDMGAVMAGSVNPAVILNVIPPAVTP